MKEISYDQVLKRKPLKKILEKYIDLQVAYWREGSPNTFACYNNLVHHYDMSFDEQKLIDNLPLIVEDVKKTRSYAECPTFREEVDSIPLKLEDMTSEFQYVSMVLGTLMDYTVATECGARKYNKTNPLPLGTFEFNKVFALKMKDPMMCVFEANGWERERWFVWFPYPTDINDVTKLKALDKKFKWLGAIDQSLGKTSYKVDFRAHEYDLEYMNPNKGSYMRTHNIKRGRVNYAEVDRLLAIKSKDDFFNEVYKMGWSKVIDCE